MLPQLLKLPSTPSRQGLICLESSGCGAYKPVKWVPRAARPITSVPPVHVTNFAMSRFPSAARDADMEAMEVHERDRKIQKRDAVDRQKEMKSMKRR